MSTQDRKPVSRTATGPAIRILTALGTAALIAACDSGGAAGDDNQGGDTSSAAVAVRVQDHPELGKVLVDGSGRTLYFADQEADGTIRCVDDCLGFWFPATSSDGSAPAVAGVPALDVVHRSDNGQDQLTYAGKPLYTFELDMKAGDIEGDNLEDDFGGTHFVWHAATIEAGGTPAPPATSGADDGGYGPGGY